MSNEKNLIPFTSNQNREEAKKNGRKGGIASGEARKKRKAFKEQVDYFLSLPFPNMADKNGNSIRDTFKSFGIEDSEIDNQMAMIISMWKNVVSRGDTSAFIALRDTVGEKPLDKVQNININEDNPYANLTEEELRKLASDE